MHTTPEGRWPLPHCRFYLRTPAGDGFRYDFIKVKADDNGFLETPYPPAVGDQVYLVSGPERSGGYRVVDRQWAYPARGSAAWRLDQRQPTEGPQLDLVVEACAGLFAGGEVDE